MGGSKWSNYLCQYLNHFEGFEKSKPEETSLLFLIAKATVNSLTRWLAVHMVENYDTNQFFPPVGEISFDCQELVDKKGSLEVRLKR
jgi:hypothetical protein